MKRFSFDKEKAAKDAKVAKSEEKQKVVNANNLLNTANKKTFVDEHGFLASISKSLASNIYNRNNSFSNVSNISKTTGLNLKIEPMKTCLHDRPCPYLDAPGRRRPICQKSGAAVFDLAGCPAGRWFL